MAWCLPWDSPGAADLGVWTLGGEAAFTVAAFFYVMNITNHASPKEPNCRLFPGPLPTKLTVPSLGTDPIFDLIYFPTFILCLYALTVYLVIHLLLCVHINCYKLLSNLFEGIVQFSFSFLSSTPILCVMLLIELRTS